MLEQLLNYNDVGLFILRLSLAIIFFYHGWPKMTKAAGMAQMIGMSAAMVFMLGLAEVVSAVAITIGFYIQWAALLMAVIMIGATYYKIVKWHMPFAAMDKTGWEFDLILFGGAVAILLGGGGSIGI